jgi:hypothetical protein
MEHNFKLVITTNNAVARTWLEQYIYFTAFPLHDENCIYLRILMRLGNFTMHNIGNGTQQMCDKKTITTKC